MEKKEIVFTDGIRTFKPREGAPETLVASTEYEMPVFIAWARQHAKDAKVRVNTWKSKTKGTYYTSLDTFEPKKDFPSFDKDSQGRKIGGDEEIEEIRPEDLPF